MRLRRIAGFALLAAALTACTSSASAHHSASPTTSAPTSSATTTSSTPSTPAPTTPSVATTGPHGAAAPTLPSDGRANTPVGSDFFTRYWMQTLGWAYETTNSSLARTAVADSCADCKRILAMDIDAQAAAHHHYVGGHIFVDRTQLQPNDHHDNAAAVVDITVVQAKLQLCDSAGRVIRTVPQTTAVTFRTWLIRRGNGWLVADWKRAIRK